MNHSLVRQLLFLLTEATAVILVCGGWSYRNVGILCSGDIAVNISMNEWMNENARILSAFENRLRAGFV